MIPALFVTARFVTYDKDYSYSAGASDLLIPSGYIPKLLPTDLGNGANFVLTKVTEHKFEYEQAGSALRLTVWNT